MRSLKVSRGFTLIELLIVIVVLTALTALGTVAVGQLQVSARDEERRADIEIIARGLEGYYKIGNSRVKTPDEDPNGFITKGTYPGANEFMYMIGAPLFCDHNELKNVFNPCFVDGGFIKEALPGVTDSAMTPPGKPGPKLSSTWFLTEQHIQEHLDNGEYIYKPLEATGEDTCYGGGLFGNTVYCPRFKLMYKEEATGNIITVENKRR